MSNEEQDFEKLNRLLKLKNHEQPPPGYFNNFSTNVINRIEAQSRRSQDEPHGAEWLRKLAGLLENNPIAAGLFGVCTCGLLIAGVAYSQYREPVEYATSNGTGLQAGDSDGSTGTTFSKVLSGSETVASSTQPMMVMDTNSQAMSFGGPSATPVLFNPGQ